MTRHSWHDDHMQHTGRSFLKALFVTFGVFLLLFFAFRLTGSLMVYYTGEGAVRQFTQGIERDLAHLSREGDAVAAKPELVTLLLARDSTGIIDLLQREKQARAIGLMGAADAEGVIIGRTKTSGKRGDNAFLLSPIGRAVAEGRSAQSVEAPIGFDPRQIFLTTGRPIMSDGEMVGALFANYLTDDEYAARFKATYLPRGVEVAFYNREAGLYGSSITDPTARSLLRSHFDSGSREVWSDISEKTISFGGDGYYLVRTVVFPGLEESPGGALLFIPRQDTSSAAHFFIACITASVFVALALWRRRHSRGEERGWRYRVVLSITTVAVFFASFFILTFERVGYTTLLKVPYTLYNSTLRLQPDFGVFDIGSEQAIAVVVDTGDEAINTVGVKILFDPKAVAVQRLEPTEGVCAYIVENTIDSEEGSATFSCVMTGKGGERGALSIATLTVAARHAGSFALSFDSEHTQVLAHDGLGTNVLRFAQASSYRADTFDLDSETSGSNGTARSFVVFSPSHPNESRWYKAPAARFVWKGKPGAVYTYTLDRHPTTTPQKSTNTQGTSVTVPIPGEGAWYFHLQAITGGPVAHYRIQSDRTPPSIVSIELSQETITAGDVVRFSFEAEDATSDIQNNYYVDLGNRLFLPIGRELFVPFVEVGEQTLTLRVYDGANNYSEASRTVTVLPK